MDEQRATEVVAALRERNVMAHPAHAGVYRVGIRVVLADGREAVWDTDGAAALDAQVLRDGVLVGFVPALPGSEDFTTEQIVETIAGTDYDDPARNDPGATGVPARRPLGARGGLQETRPRTGGGPTGSAGAGGAVSRLRRRLGR